MRKCVVLNILEPTSRKLKILEIFRKEYRKAMEAYSIRLPDADNQTQLHHLVYSAIRKTSTLPSDIVQEARKDVWKNREDIVSNGSRFKRFSIRLSRRWFRYIRTNRGNPVFKITYSTKKTVSIPIRLDGQYERFLGFFNNGWSFNNVSLLMDGRISVVLEKEFPEPEIQSRYVIGIDVGSDTLAAITVLDSEGGKTIKQLYLGRDVARRQGKYIQRRAKLKSLADKGSSKARKSLRRLKKRQSDFVKTRSGQIAKEIVNLAIKHDAYISIEKLKNLKARKGKMRKSARKKINIIPYGKFKQFLESNCEQFGIPLHVVDAYHTSKWCVRCGALNRGHGKNYALYTCGCGFVGNSDRKASKAIAVKSLLMRNETHVLTKLGSFQSIRSGDAVNRLVRPDVVGSVNIAVQHTESPMESPPL